MLRAPPSRSELSWATITNPTGATEATVNFDLCPPVGSHQLTLESIDLNSPLSPAYSVLKTDVINLSVTALAGLYPECQDPVEPTDPVNSIPYFVGFDPQEVY